jgi:GT2 family glycosyltransferase
MARVRDDRVIELSGGRLALAFVGTAALKALRAWREGRLSLAPSRWLRDLALHWGELREHGVPLEPRRARRRRMAAHELRRTARAALDRLVAGDRRLAWRTEPSPLVSVVLPLFNRAELTLAALESLPREGVEIILVDNGSTDRTAALLDRLDGPRIVRNPNNLGYLDAVNQAAALAQGEYLLLLNSDTLLSPGSLAAALATLEASPDIAAVGARLVLPDGTLQEAGSIVWQDGWCQGYGRGSDPGAGPYNFQRDVDYCSAACLLIRRTDFIALDGFDPRYRPAYYEDVDLCVRLWRRGRRVVYEPRMVAIHVEHGSGSSGQAASLQRDRHALFVAAHGEWLANQPPRAAGALAARVRPSRAPRVLVIDDRVPLRRLGSGCPRAASLTAALVAAGCQVTIHPTAFPSRRPEPTDGLPPTVEVLGGGDGEALAETLRERLPLIDRLLVSRPANLERVEAALRQVGAWPAPVPIIYDAEAIEALRHERWRALHGLPMETEALDHELRRARSADTVLAVSPAEQALFAAAGARRVLCLGHALRPVPGPRPFADRAGLLFVGAFYEPDSPNSDGVRWFAREVWPLLRARLGRLRLVIAGARPGRSIRALAADDVEVLGSVPDLTPLYDQARVFIAPTRFAAGLPHKVHEAAAHGLPVVATSLLADQLGWRDGAVLSVADDPVSYANAVACLHEDETRWRRQRAAALDRVATDCAPGAFAATVEEALRIG